MTSKIYDFDEQLKLGKLGEAKVFKYLNSLSDTIDAVDLSEVKRFQGYGIDGLLITDHENRPFSPMLFDIKTDYQFRRSGKLFFEITADTDKEGGILSTKAEVFYYYDPFGGDLFRIPIFGLRQWYEKVGISMHHVTINNKSGQETSGIFVDPYDLENGAVRVPILKLNIGGLDPKDMEDVK